MKGASLIIAVIQHWVSNANSSASYFSYIHRGKSGLALIRQITKHV
jgi:hypothetical protein